MNAGMNVRLHDSAEGLRLAAAASRLFAAFSNFHDTRNLRVAAIVSRTNPTCASRMLH
jgi:hypothetical protein